MSGTPPYYTQAFSPLPGRCFRLVAGGEGGGRSTARTRPSGGAFPCPQRPPLPGRGMRGRKQRRLDGALLAMAVLPIPAVAFHYAS
jgi:hypothetical protein